MFILGEGARYKVDHQRKVNLNVVPTVRKDVLAGEMMRRDRGDQWHRLCAKDRRHGVLSPKLDKGEIKYIYEADALV